MFLSRLELEELTGFVRAAKQIEWLKANGWKFAEDSQHRPKVARSYFDARLGASQNVPVTTPAAAIRPNFEVLRKSNGAIRGA